MTSHWADPGSRWNADVTRAELLIDVTLTFDCIRFHHDINRAAGRSENCYWNGKPEECPILPWGRKKHIIAIFFIKNKQYLFN